VRETVKSLRAYFIVVGIFAALLGAGRLAVLVILAPHIAARRASIPSTDLLAIVLLVIAAIVSLGLGAAFIAVGIGLPKLLRGSSQRIVTLLYFSLGANVLFFALSLPFGFNVLALMYFAAGLLLVWYLLKNVRRLALEAAQHSGAP
jgi:hypothetical protein